MSKELDGRIALVEGWTGIRPSTLWGDADLMGFPPSKLLSFVPRWSSDLNLMWELEEGLNEREKMEYLKQFGVGCWVYIHATAEEKAAAYLSVIEK